MNKRQPGGSNVSRRIWLILLPMIFLVVVSLAIDTFHFARNYRQLDIADTKRIPQEIIDAIREKFGMNDSMLKRYWDYLLSRARWDLGPSLYSRAWDVVDLMKPSVFQGLLLPVLVCVLITSFGAIPIRRQLRSPVFYYIIGAVIVVTWIPYGMILERAPIVEICICLCVLAIALSSWRFRHVQGLLVVMCCSAIAIYYSFTISATVGLNRWNDIIVGAARHRDYPLIEGIGLFQNRVALAGATIAGYMRVFFGRDAMWRSNA